MLQDPEMRAVIVPGLPQFQSALGRGVYYIVNRLTGSPQEGLRGGDVLRLNRFGESASGERTRVLTQIIWESGRFVLGHEREVPLVCDWLVIYHREKTNVTLRPAEEVMAMPSFDSMDDAVEFLERRTLPSLSELIAACGRGRYYVSKIALKLEKGELSPGDIFKEWCSDEDQSTSNRQVSTDKPTHLRVQWRTQPIKLTDPITIPRSTRRRAMAGVISRINPGVKYAMHRGRLTWLDKEHERKPPRSLQPGERWVDVPPIAFIIRHCGKGRYFVASQDVKLWDSHTLRVLEEYPSGSVFKLVEGTSECSGDNQIAEFHQVHWEKWKRAGKKLVIDDKPLRLPLEQVGKPLIAEYKPTVRYQVIRTVASVSAKATCDAPKPRAGRMPITREAQSDDWPYVAPDMMGGDDTIDPHSTPLTHVPGMHMQTHTDVELESDAHGVASDLPNFSEAIHDCETQSLHRALEKQDEEDDEDEDKDDCRMRGICVACLEMEALFVGQSCGHLVYCLHCFQDSVSTASKKDTDQPQQKGKKSKSWKSTAIVCPVCRTKASLVEREKYKHNVWVVEPFS